MKFKYGQKVEHVLNKEYLLVLGYMGTASDEQYLCRTKDMRKIICYEFELREVK